MIVGIMTNKKPTKLAKFTSLICENYGIEIIYLNPDDVNMDKNTVNGKVLINNRRRNKETEIPPFIDIAPYCYKNKNKNITEYLNKQTFLSDNRYNVLTKRALQEQLKQDPEFSHLVIPTLSIRKFEDLQSYSEQYPKFVLKPSGGIQGKGIYILEKHENNYLIGYKTEERYYDEDEMKEFYNENIASKGYVLQKYVSSRTPQGDPFDCRVHVEKNGKGKWQSAKNYIRIGIGQKVISNVKQGGGIADPRQFLKANYDDQWGKINKELNRLAVTLPYKVEQLRGTHIMSLGMDIGVSKDGKMYVFEVNDGPSTKAAVAEVAYLRSNYYKYILEHKLGISLKKQNFEFEDYQAVLEEKEYYKEEYSKMKDSTSWMLTAPLRKIGILKKNLKKFKL